MAQAILRRSLETTEMINFELQVVVIQSFLSQKPECPLRLLELT